MNFIWSELKLWLFYFSQILVNLGCKLPMGIIAAVTFFAV